MDELSTFRGALNQLQILEKYLLKSAGLVFTGGVSLFEARRGLHPNVHPFPSGVDLFHFCARSQPPGEFREREGVPRPRLGYAGVIGERLDLALLEEVAFKRPSWQIVMIGPTAKIWPTGSGSRQSALLPLQREWPRMNTYGHGSDQRRTFGILPAYRNG
jgi:hypothetical protein